MIIAALATLFQTIKRFAMFVLNQGRYVKVLGAYYDILQLEEHPEELNQAKANSISLENVEYQYPQSDLTALKDVSIDFKIGQKVAVVGHNGSGKTTFVSVILNLLKSQKGVLNTKGVVVSSLFQDFGCYQMTVRENVEMGIGGKKIADDELISILKKVDMYDFIMSKEKGLDSMLGQFEDGEELSKGQWQRLAIARLLANKDANVWILDEPTAYLDPIAEVEVYKLIFDLSENRLVFFVSHRLGFAKYSDRIIVLENGTIIEDGSHEDLTAKKNGRYAEMFESQRKWYT